MNSLICIGVDSYDRIAPLQGAQKDAQEVFNILGRSGLYDAVASRLLLSPTADEIAHSLGEVFQEQRKIDVCTFFFAGHAAVKDGSFFLCTRESDAARLSTTAFAMVRLFTMINEVRPAQANIIVDACQAGGSSFDLNQLIKPEAIGSSTSASISFLGACAADQYAGETAHGGIVTRELLKCLSGETMVQETSPFLDLIDVGAMVCRIVKNSTPMQHPMCWGLSLFGNGRLAKNPHFQEAGEERAFKLVSISPDSFLGKQARVHSAELWEMYRQIRQIFSPRRYLEILQKITSKTSDISEQLSFLEGITRTMVSRTENSREMFASILCLATGLVLLLPHSDQTVVRGYIKNALPDLVHRLKEIFVTITDSVSADRNALLNDNDPLSNLYYLPLRITKILGWLGAAVFLSENTTGGAALDSSIFDAAKKLLTVYPRAFAAVSDEQAPPLYIFFASCARSGETELAEAVLNQYFASFAHRKGKLARAESDGIRAINFIRSLGPTEIHHPRWRPANPSILLPVLLRFGRLFKMDSVWDLRDLDRLNGSFFIPENYRDFAAKVIAEGLAHNFQMGFGVWSLADFEREFNAALSKHSTVFEVNEETTVLILLASLLFPDRIPLVLEKRIGKTSEWDS